MSETKLHTQHIHHEGRDIGLKHKHHMAAKNIAAPDQTPDWRVAEREFIRWMKYKGFKYYDRGTVTQ